MSGRGGERDKKPEISKKNKRGDERRRKLEEIGRNWKKLNAKKADQNIMGC